MGKFEQETQGRASSRVKISFEDLRSSLCPYDPSRRGCSATFDERIDQRVDLTGFFHHRHVARSVQHVDDRAR